MRDHRRRPRTLLALAAFALLSGGCTTGFDLLPRAADASTEASTDASADASTDASTDAPPDPDAAAGLCRQAGDRCCMEAARGAFCVGGLVCSEGYCAPCPGSLFPCGNACVDLRTSASHCGACGVACPENQRCAGGGCVLDCPPPGIICGGRCVDLQADDAHCGGCGRSCAGAADSHSVGRCVRGACVRSCAPGYGDCDGSAANGCEVDTRTSASHCGGCGLACSPPRATGGCVAGACTVARCNAGYGDCDGSAGNGCEVDIHHDIAHCGACGHACAAGQTCRDGLCLAVMVTCSPGSADCRSDAPGCETVTLNDVMNCGGCGRVCSFPDASATCASSACRIGSCRAGYDNCDGAPANGCEVRTATDLAHCGGCGRACSAPNGQAVCSSGQCSLASCSPGYGDCDRTAANGCEADLGSSASHCGGCGQACAPANARGVCDGGRCVVRGCTDGFADCDGSASNGCEVTLASDPANCGRCGLVCPPAQSAALHTTTSTCSNGGCSFECAPGWADCNHVSADGCEASLTDVDHCGSCSTPCIEERGSMPVCCRQSNGGATCCRRVMLSVICLVGTASTCF